MDRGELPESTEICRELDSSILAASIPLQNANIMVDIKVIIHITLSPLISNFDLVCTRNAIECFVIMFKSS